MKYVHLFISLLLLNACLEKDPLIARPGPDELSFELEPAEQNRVFIDLSEKTISATYDDTLWHLKFQNGEGNWAIFLNPLYDISLFKTTETNFSLVDYTFILEPLQWQKDVPLKNAILPAFGTWGDYDFDNPKSFRSIYLIRVKIGASLVYYKVQILDAVGGNYRLRFGKLDGSVDHSYLVQKDPKFTHSYLRLGDQPKMIYCEPPAANWDLCFTYGIDSIAQQGNKPVVKQWDDYIGIFPMISLNKSRVEVAVESLLTFEEINYFYAKERDYVAYEQLPNLLAEFNADRKIYEAAEEITLLIKVGDLYYKVKANNVSTISFYGISSRLAIESL